MVMSINLNEIKKIHFIGIGGIGLSAIAKLMVWQGKKVSGSDCQASEITDELKELGVKIFIGHNKKNLDKDVGLAAYTLAVGQDNPEIQKAKKLNIPILTYPEFLGLLIKDKFGIAISGTHGKSTVTSMVALILEKAGLDPTVVVGGKISEFGGNVRISKSKYFIFEACEYQRAFLNYWPKVIVLNNIELDHTDYYKDIKDYESAFEEFIGHLPKDGVLIVNEKNQKSKIKNQNYNSKCKILSFGIDKKNDLVAYDIKFENGKTKFNVNFKNKNLGEFSLQIPGIFNVYNALAAISVGLLLGIDIEIIKKTLAEFKGIWRRFEHIGNCQGAEIYSDYAHHPTEVRSTIDGARKFFPGKRIIAVFQPHQHNRTKNLFQNFINSFDNADLIILNEIFDVAGRENINDQNISSLDLVNEIKKHSKNKTVLFGKNLKETEKLILENIKKNDVVLIMGAGDIYKLNSKFKTQKPKL